MARPELYSKRTESEVLAAYRSNFKLGDDIDLSHVNLHAELEAVLTDKLLSSQASERASVFKSAYSDLYAKLPWLATTGNSDRQEEWCRLLVPGSRVIEIGSGAGLLVRFLATQGYSCVGTELSDHRGEALASPADNLEWQATDGVNLTEFHTPQAFDHVISDQVVEHIHPEDIQKHFETARMLLKDGGSYIVRTPHRSAGPHDLSRVFGFSDTHFMHLKEYGFKDLSRIAREAGFRRASAILSVPAPWSNERRIVTSTLLNAYNSTVESLEDRIITNAAIRRGIRRFGKVVGLPSSVWVKLEI